MDTIVHIEFRTQTRGYTLLLEIDLLGERMGGKLALIAATRSLPQKPCIASLSTKSKK